VHALQYTLSQSDFRFPVEKGFSTLQRAEIQFIMGGKISKWGKN
jgi:hypothetical protein